MSSAAAEPGGGGSVRGVSACVCVCSLAPSASSPLFSECHSLHYQSKVCYCLCAYRLLSSAGFCFAVIDKNSVGSQTFSQRHRLFFSHYTFHSNFHH